MNVEEIYNRYQNQYIKPIVWRDGKPVYLRRLSKEEFFELEYYWQGQELFNRENEKEVDISLLTILADVKIKHPYSPYRDCKITAAEIIEQIPENLLDRVEAFLIRFMPHGRNEMKLFSQDFEENNQILIVRLYEKKNKTNEAAKAPGIYPEEYAKLPLGMTKEDFEELKKVLEKRYR